MRQRVYLYLLLITGGALLVHGYHPGVEDAEIYIPAVKKLLDPRLYPFDSEFFLNHARLTLFDELIAASVRVFHLAFDVDILIWYLLSVFLTLLACWRITGECFREAGARWAGVMTVAALLTIPVAGTSLYIADQYLTSRSLVTVALLFAISSALRESRIACCVWSAVALFLHPLMAVFGISLTAVLWLQKQRESSVESPSLVRVYGAFPILNIFPTTSIAYQEAVDTRSYFFIAQWHWYEWLGALAPILLLWLIGLLCARHSLKTARGVCQALIVYTISYLILSVFLTMPVGFQAPARFQPMRSLHLLYILMFLLIGGVLGKWVLRGRAWRWIALFLPLCGGMFYAQRQLFPASAHIEWPGAAPANDWLRAFTWIRRNTPKDAFFAIDPDYMNEDDEHGFRVIAERSRLADAVKDSGAVTMFPELPAADHWLEQLTDQRGWRHFHEDDFRRLERKYGVNWVVSPRPFPVSFGCPYENQTVRVCRLD
jgi:hypothetical protein